MRIQKYLAGHSSLSRRKVEALIEDGHILVNGKQAKLGQLVKSGDAIQWEKKSWFVEDEQCVTEILLYHKPVGEIVTRASDERRPTIFEQLPACQSGRWVAVGRLDINTQGLIILTNNGTLAHQLMHPSSTLLRYYKVRVLGECGEGTINKLLSGIVLEGSLCKFHAIKCISKASAGNKWYDVTVFSGKYRMVRRLWQAVGCQVNRLIRYQFGPVQLPETLRPGEYKRLSHEEVQSLQRKIHKL